MKRIPGPDLGEAVTPGCVRVCVAESVTLGEVSGLYFERAPNMRSLLRTLRELGVTRFLRKVASRRAERDRNSKWVVGGWGVVETSLASVSTGTPVVFVATSSSIDPAHVVVNESLVTTSGRQRGSEVPSHRPPEHVLVLSALLAGWSRHSGENLDVPAVSAIHEWLTDIGAPNATRPCGDCEVKEYRPCSRPSQGGKPTAVLFGYGNYAKTVVLPEIAKSVDLRTIHELDQQQVRGLVSTDTGIDTNPGFRSAEFADIAFITAYHHHHGPLAVESLRRGIIPVIEKPIATTKAQAAELRDALQEGVPAFACFQRRYSPVAKLLEQDLVWSPGQPLDYHCIVYEEPLPPKHWYRWPNSGGRLSSNGCHWIDHFLGLNGYVAVVNQEAFRGSSGTVAVILELANGALFTMSLTERGDTSNGLRDYIELRSENAHATLVNSQLYRSFNGGRQRTKSFARQEFHERMYREICQKILDGEGGDSEDQLLATAELTIELERHLQTEPNELG